MSSLRIRAFVAFTSILLALLIVILSAFYGTTVGLSALTAAIISVAGFAVALIASWIVTGWLLRAAERSLQSARGAVDDVRQQLSREQAQALHYETILQQMTDAVVVIDARGHVRFINRAFSHLFDIDPNSVRGESLEGTTLNYQVSMLTARALHQSALQRDRVELSHPRERVLEGVSTPLKGDDGEVTGAMTLLHDITRLEQLDRVRRDFVANASHELRTPAAGIKALAEALQAGAIDEPERGRSFCKQLVDAADRLTEILDDMLTLTRVERGEELLEPQVLSARAAIDDALAHVRAAANSREINLKRAVPEEDQLFADPDALKTLLVNLLDNAIKYTPDGGTVTATGRRVDDGYRVQIADTGIGIPSEHQERIFERFYRVDRARDRATGSTGLGLAIVKHIAEAHGGEVSVSSRSGEGSIFTLTLPGS